MKIILAVLAAMMLTMSSAYATNLSGNEVVVSVGKTVANSEKDSSSHNFSVTLRHSISQKYAVSLQYLNEGHPLGWPKRDGVAVEAWWVPFGVSSKKFQLSVGAGPYLYASTVNAPASRLGFRDEHGVALLISVDTSYRVTHNVAVHIGWHRVVTSSNTDTDVVLLGIGYSM